MQVVIEQDIADLLLKILASGIVCSRQRELALARKTACLPMCIV